MRAALRCAEPGPLKGVPAGRLGGTGCLAAAPAYQEPYREKLATMSWGSYHP